MNEKFIPEIERPETCKCSVYSLEPDIEFLTIMVTSSTTRLFLGFHYVRYFSGFLRWDGAVFDIMPREMCIELLGEAGYGTKTKISVEELVDNYYGTNLKLYKVSVAKPAVEILARHVIVYNESMQTIGSHGL